MALTKESDFVLDLSNLLDSFGLSQHQITEVCKQATVATLSKQQRFIYDELDPHIPVDCKYLSFATGIDTKNISSQIKQIQSKTNLIGVVKGKKHKYFKN